MTIFYEYTCPECKNNFISNEVFWSECEFCNTPLEASAVNKNTNQTNKGSGMEDKKETKKDLYEYYCTRCHSGFVTGDLFYTKCTECNTPMMVQLNFNQTSNGSSMENNKDVGVKHDEGKLRWDLLPFDSIQKVVEILTEGCVEYGERNWQKGIKYARLIASCFRHLISFIFGIDVDMKSKKLHLAHLGCNVLMLLHFELNRDKYVEFDNRYSYPNEVRDEHKKLLQSLKNYVDTQKN